MKKKERQKMVENLSGRECRRSEFKSARKLAYQDMKKCGINLLEEEQLIYHITVRIKHIQ